MTTGGPTLSTIGGVGSAAITGNDVELVEASASEATRKLRGRSGLWRDIKRDGVAVYGATVTDLMERQA